MKIATQAVLLRELEKSVAEYALKKSVAEYVDLLRQNADLERESAALRDELNAQAVVNGKGGEREAKLMAACVEYRAKLDKLERELQVANSWVEHHQNHCDDLIKENAALRAELNAQAVVNGKGSEREAKLLAENAALRQDKERLDWLESLRSLWEGNGETGPVFLTRASIDAARKEAQP